MPNLSACIGTADLFIKRDDCTGLAMGGNKARQLEFYVGQAKRQQADTIVITGAVQSNFTRMAAAAARKAGMDIHIQLEERVLNKSPNYRNSGNLLLSRLMGATMHSYPRGDDEVGADLELENIAAELRENGKKPFVIHLGQDHPPYGALGYVVAAHEINQQIVESGQRYDEIVVASGSGATHAGLLFGLRAVGNSTPIKGICVRRPVALQAPRVIQLCQRIADLRKMENPICDSDVDLNDDVLAPGYGLLNGAVSEAVSLTAKNEGMVVDPVYTGKAMAGFFNRARQADKGQKLLFIHTGGQPAVFAYEADLAHLLSDSPY
jgi:D-cysteine desulfhydrase/L-cysteate sulfo-lyase